MDVSAGKTETLTDALEGVSEWVLLLRPDGIVEWSNRAFNEFMGTRAGSPRDIRTIFPADADAIMEDLHEVIDSGELRAGIVQIGRAHV